jgi:5-methylcytosine-specific restriction endonuclease McrA
MGFDNKYQVLQKLRKSERYKEWRRRVFQRDDYTCRKCGQSGGYLNAHHIKSFAKYKKLRFDVNNGITLCQKCHNKFHSIYGITSFTKKNLKEFLRGG